MASLFILLKPASPGKPGADIRSIRLVPGHLYKTCLHTSQFPYLEKRGLADLFEYVFCVSHC